MPHLIYVLFRIKALEQMSVIRLVVGLKVQILRFGQNINVIRQRIKDFNKNLANNKQTSLTQCWDILLNVAVHVMEPSVLCSSYHANQLAWLHCTL